MAASFRVEQNAILENAEGRVLLLQKKGKWMLPGGGLELNETGLEGLRRELREETGITNFSIERIIDAETSDGKEAYIVTFVCKLQENKDVALSN